MGCNELQHLRKPIAPGLNDKKSRDNKTSTDKGRSQNITQFYGTTMFKALYL